MLKFAASALCLNLVACLPASYSLHAPAVVAGAKWLNGEELRRLLHGKHTILKKDYGGVTVSHPAYEAFLTNGKYFRSPGRTRGDEGTFSIEDDLLCVSGDTIPKQCRRLSPQGGDIYLLFDVSTGQQTPLMLVQRR